MAVSIKESPVADYRSIKLEPILLYAALIFFCLLVLFPILYTLTMAHLAADFGRCRV